MAISVDSPEAHALFAKNLNPNFIFLSDQDREVTKTYGLVHSKAREGEDIARPATFLIDKQGKVRWAHISSNFLVRPAPGEVVKRLKELQ